MVQILMAVMLFLGLSTVASADFKERPATGKNKEAVAWQPTQATPVVGHHANTNSKLIAEKYAAVLGDLRPLAEQGNAEAQYKLGLMYSKGQGVVQNYVVACMWLNLANAGSTGDLSADTIKARFEISSMMAPNQVAAAQRLAIEWQKKRSPDMPTPSKEDLLDTFAKVEACSDAGYLKNETIEQVIVPRVQYYARLFFTEWDIDQIGASIPNRKKSAVTVFGWGCESAYNKLLALPLPGGPTK